jgi:TPR repeat protein
MVFWATLSALAIAAPAQADFQDGLEAFDAGDYETVLEEWLPLAKAGNVDAQIALAGMYRQGVGVKRDLGRAIELYRAAALQGHVSGQLNLGDMYATGTGVERNLIYAYGWLSLASKQGHSWAKDRLAEVAAKMTEDEIELAKSFADYFLK